jgi:hypothetical protein
MATAKKGVAVTPHATNPLTAGIADSLYVGGAGTLVVRHPGESADATYTMVAGGYLLARVSHVRATSTATLIMALYL